MIARLCFVVFVIPLLQLPVAALVAADSPAVPDPHPLATADTSNPRDTLLGFDANVTKALQAWKAGAPLEKVLEHARLAFEAFDFSHLARDERLVKEVETALWLKEILDRIDLPPEEQIPGEAEVADEKKALTEWTIPNTKITIEKIKEGSQAGEFLFSAETVDNLETFYNRAKQLPYKPGALVGIHDDFLHSPGYLVPSSWARALPAWSKFVVFGKTVWQWLFLASVLIASFLAIRVLFRLGRRWDKRQKPDAAVMRFGTPLSILAGVLILFASRSLLLYGARITGDSWDILYSVIWILIFAGLGWLVVIITGRIADAINAARRTKTGSIDGQLVRVVLRLASMIVLVFLLLYAADFFGVPLTPVIAGLGVGGLAIALAVRPTLENIIGGLTLFADKPVRIGDFCRFGNETGTVEAIGLRSIRLRKQDDTVVSVPNADFSQRELTNYTQRRQRLYQTSLGLRYETTAEQLRYVIAKLREMLLGHPMVSPEKLHVRFDGFGAYSLDVEVFAYIRTPDWLEYLAIREDINFRIIDIVNDAGSGFAFPSQTTYLGRDAGLNAERGSNAESAVEDWRAKGQLPFPEFDPALQSAREDALDYPPRGSPNYRPQPGVSETQPGSKTAFEPLTPMPSKRWRWSLKRDRH